jgi:hypothetical protein
MGDLFEDREGAAERLHPDPLPVVGVVVDIVVRRRLHQLGDGGLARSGRLLSGLLFDTRTHQVKPPCDIVELCWRLSLAAGLLRDNPLRQA